jgi:hypothetical protein
MEHGDWPSTELQRLHYLVSNVIQLGVLEGFFLHGSFFCPEDGGTRFLQNFKHIGNYDVNRWIYNLLVCTTIA